MTQSELTTLKRAFENNFKSLENDCKRAFFDIPVTPVIQVSPFPIVMFAMSNLDYFSSVWAGWSDSRSPNKGTDRRSQTQRMIDFLTTFLGYSADKSKLMVKMYRHNLMHTSEPRLFMDGGDIYSWSISPQLDDVSYLLIQDDEENSNIHWLHFGVKNFIEDLKEGVLGSGKYFDQLSTDTDLQTKCVNCLREVHQIS